MAEHTRRLSAIALVASSLAALAACGQPGQTLDAATPSSPAVTLVDAGTLLTCTHLPYEPFQSLDGDTGDIVGFDVDLGDLVADRLGLEQRVVDVPFDRITSGAALEDGTCDIAFAGMTITEERAEVLDFGVPYFNANQALLADWDSTIAGLDDLHGGGRLGVQENTTGADYAGRYATEHDAAPTIHTYRDLPALTQALRAGEIDAALADNGPLYHFARSHRNTSVKVEIDTGEQYGFAVRRGNTELLTVANEVLAGIRQDGRYEELHRKWFGVTPNQW
ncbi:MULTISPECIES: transporter substrate-binding domain-containing protein [Actinoalloteichus]|uniref:Polar amino acid transport system substrate-binding protein n=1 Tax=Actinoalloteichus caeruleus DSM 43889 TaxID=1120930 RepID=A0ABT1JKK4_ACTCY|nr:transporter substrate-binding domain-containing protein [Actinoalloteichus caeruleus]MCP2333039.1 polar amino acid transport system substrate-binding protein [Actinoalloteichus caeruleus DSM 43889]